MVTKEAVEQFVNEKLSGTDYVLVDVAFEFGNLIVIKIDSTNAVDIDFCAELSRSITAYFGDDLDDYELEVGSVGLTTPFKTLFQYQKNIGNEVEVLTKDGRKFTGVLTMADEQQFTVEIAKKVCLEGEKRKTLHTEPQTFDYESVKYTKYLIKFK